MTRPGGGEGEPRRWRCEITTAFLDGAERDLRAALLRRHDRLAAGREARRRRLLPWLRALGLACAALGILLAGWAIVVTPDQPCTQARLWGYHLVLVFYVLAGTVLWFLPQVSEAMLVWARRAVAGRAPRLLAPLRKRAPYAVEYALSGERLETRAEKVGLRRSADLNGFGAALAAPSLACLYRGRQSAWLRRVVYFPDAGARAALVEALTRAGVEVSEVPVGE